MVDLPPTSNAHCVPNSPPPPPQTLFTQQLPQKGVETSTTTVEQPAPGQEAGPPGLEGATVDEGAPLTANEREVVMADASFAGAAVNDVAPVADETSTPLQVREPSPTSAGDEQVSKVAETNAMEDPVVAAGAGESALAVDGHVVGSAEETGAAVAEGKVDDPEIMDLIGEPSVVEVMGISTDKPVSMVLVGASVAVFDEGDVEPTAKVVSGEFLASGVLIVYYYRRFLIFTVSLHQCTQISLQKAAINLVDNASKSACPMNLDYDP